MQRRVAGDGSVRHETRSSSGPLLPPRRQVRPLPQRPPLALTAAPRGPLRTRHVSAARRPPLPALALAPPHLTSHRIRRKETTEFPGKQNVSSEGSDPSELNFNATGGTSRETECRNDVSGGHTSHRGTLGGQVRRRLTLHTPSPRSFRSALFPSSSPLHDPLTPISPRASPRARHAASKPDIARGRLSEALSTAQRGIFGRVTFLRGNTNPSTLRSAASSEQHACVGLGDTPRCPAGRVRPQPLLPDGPSTRTADWPGYLETDRRRFS